MLTNIRPHPSSKDPNVSSHSQRASARSSSRPNRSSQLRPQRREEYIRDPSMGCLPSQLLAACRLLLNSSRQNDRRDFGPPPKPGKRRPPEEKFFGETFPRNQKSFLGNSREFPGKRIMQQFLLSGPNPEISQNKFRVSQKKKTCFT